jgi:serine/threonine protein kinase
VKDARSTTHTALQAVATMEQLELTLSQQARHIARGDDELAEAVGARHADRSGHWDAAYMAPEQARGKVVDRRADIWAFGAVLFEMLSGQRAFEAKTSR